MNTYMGADLAERSQGGRRVHDAAILTTHHYANLANKLEGYTTRVDFVDRPAVSQLQACGQTGYVDPADFLKIFCQE